MDSTRLFSPVFAVGVVLAAAIGGAAAWLAVRRPSPLPDTLIEERAFRLTLPGHWQREPSDDATRFNYRSDSGRESLTVSLFGLEGEAAGQERAAYLKRLVEIRRGLEEQVPESDSVTLTETTFAESNGTLAARFNGVERESRRFNCLFLMGRSALTVYYYESLGMTQEDSDARARTIMNSIHAPK